MYMVMRITPALLTSSDVNNLLGRDGWGPKIKYPRGGKKTDKGEWALLKKKSMTLLTCEKKQG